MSATGVKTLSEVVKELKERLGDQQALFDADIKAFQQTVLDKYGRSASSDDVAKFTKEEPALMAKIFHTPKDTQFVIGLLNGIVADKTGYATDAGLISKFAEAVVARQQAVQPDVKRKDGHSSTIEKDFSRHVLERDGNVCLITGATDNLTAAHIVPRKSKDILSDTKLSINDSYMGLTMTREVHASFDRYEFYIDPTTCKTVVSKVHPPSKGLITAGVVLQDGQKQLYNNLIGSAPCYPTTAILKLRQDLFMANQKEKPHNKKRKVDETKDVKEMKVAELRQELTTRKVGFSEKKDKKAKLQELLLAARGGVEKVVEKGRVGEAEKVVKKKKD